LIPVRVTRDIWDVVDGIHVALAGLKSAWRSEEVTITQRRRIAGILLAVVALFLGGLVLWMLAHVIVWASSFFLDSITIDIVHTAMSPGTVLPAGGMITSIATLFLLQSCFDMDTTFYAVFRNGAGANATEALLGRPPAPLMKRLKRSAWYQLKQGSVAVISLACLALPMLGYVFVPLLVYVRLKALLKACEVPGELSLKLKLFVVLGAGLAAFQFPAVRSCGPGALVFLTVGPKLARSMAGGQRSVPPQLS